MKLILNLFLVMFWAPAISWGGLATIEKPAVIAIEGFGAEGSADSQSMSQSICRTVQGSLSQWNFYTQQPAPCLNLKAGQITQVLQQAKTAGRGGFVIHLKRVSLPVNSSAGIELSLWILSSEDETDPQHLRWEISGAGEVLPSVQRILKKYSDFDGRRSVIKKMLLLNGLPNSKKLGVNPNGLVVLEETGEPVTFQKAYQAFLSEDPQHKNYLAAGLQIAALMGVGTIGYYSGDNIDNSNNVDWDYNLRQSMQARFVDGDALRFDDNGFSVNRDHYFAGLLYYTVARESGLNRLESVLFTAAASSFWEYFSEYREVVSINDQINTTLGGFIIGEALHQMGKIFQAGPNTGMNRILRGVFQSPKKLSHWIEKSARGKGATPFEMLDAKPDIWAKLDVYAGLVKAQNSASGNSIGLRSEVFNIPLFEQPGRVRELLVDDTVYSSFEVEQSLGPSLDVFRLYVKTTLAAIYDKNLGKTVEGRLQGYNLVVGPSMGVDINQELSQGSIGGRDDYRGIVHVFGSTVDLTIYHNGFRFRCVLDLFRDFAMIRSYAFDDYSNQHDVSGVQSVLRKRGYYYGLGGTQSLSVIAAYKKWEMGSRVQETSSSMIGARTRFYDVETESDDANDRIKNVQFWVAYQFNPSLRIEAGVQKIVRDGKMNAVEVTGSDLRKFGRLVYSYK